MSEVDLEECDCDPLRLRRAAFTSISIDVFSNKVYIEMSKHISPSKRARSTRKMAAFCRMREEICQDIGLNYPRYVLDNLCRQEWDGEGSGRKEVLPPEPEFKPEPEPEFGKVQNGWLDF